MSIRQNWMLRRTIAGRWAPIDFIALLAILVIVAMLLFRLGLFGLAVTSTTPEDGAAGVSNQPTITIAFDEPPANPDALAVVTNPPIEFVSIWRENQVVLQPIKPLLPETTYSVEIAPSLENGAGRPLRSSFSWEFTTRAPRLLYLAWDNMDVVQLYTFDLGTGRSTQLTNANADVVSYAANSSGDQVATSISREDGGADIWLLDLITGNNEQILDCTQFGQEMSCAGLVWRPGSTLLSFEQRPTGTNTTNNLSRLFWIDTRSGETSPIFNDPSFLGNGISFTTDGAWLAYLSPADPAVRVINLETRQENLFPSQAGQIPKWQPGSTQLIVGDLHLLQGGFALHMYLVNSSQPGIVDLSNAADIEDAGAAWSYDGEWIAFGRKAPRVSQGRQIWLHNLATGEQLQLTDSYTINHGFVSWSFDNQWLLHQQFDLDQPTLRPAIWVFDMRSSEQQMLVDQGFLPSWLP